LKERGTSEVTLVIDDALPPQARNALVSLHKVMALEDLPDEYSALPSPESYIRVIKFRSYGDRIEFLQGSVFPKVYRVGDCRFTVHLFLARTVDGEWKQDGYSFVA